MKRKISLAILFFLMCLSTSACKNRDTLLFLNWGEYIDEELLDSFEEEFDCTVVMELADSNEAFYSKVKSGTTVYDVVCPSDYMVVKMLKSDLLSEIDFSKLTNYDTNNLLPGVEGIISSLEDSNEGISKYFVPYLWGTWGMMYSTNKEGLADAVLNSTNEWNPLFDRTALPNSTRVAMYDSNQHAYYAACKYLGIDNTLQLSVAELNRVYNLIKNMNFDSWGTDDIKKKIAANNLDLGFMWTGDFLYYYCERISDLVSAAYERNSSIDCIEMIQSLIDTGSANVNGREYKIGFDLFIPEDTIAFCDNLVITKKAVHKDLATEFINYMCRPENAFANAYYVAYDTPFESVYDEIVDLQSGSVENGDYDMIYDLATGHAYQNYYPKFVENEKGYKGNILAAFDRKYINEINAVFNNARV